jgi:hypothetical protein
MRTTLLLLAALVGLVAGSAVVRGQADDAPAARAARARREGVKTVVIEYERVDVYVEGAGSGGATQRSQPKDTAPGDKHTLKTVNKFVLDGDKFRSEESHPHFVGARREIKAFKQVSVYDGLLTRTFFPDLIQPGGGPSGAIDRGIRDMTGKRFSPLMMAFRGDDPTLCEYSTDKLKPADGVLSIDGDECKEYRLLAGRSTATTSLWLDPARDYLPRRICVKNGGSVTRQTDVTYRRDDAGRWVPASWVSTYSFLPRYPVVTTTRTVLDVQFNVPQPAEQFELQFPPGTTVGDNRLPAPPAGGTTITRKIVDFEDRYFLLSVPPGAALVAVVVVLYVLRRRKAPATQPPPGP